MKKLFLSALALVCLAGCDKYETRSFCPTWKGFRYYTRVNGQKVENGAVHPGDSLYIIAEQDQKGQLINRTVYTWTLICDTLDGDGVMQTNCRVTYEVKTNYSGLDSGDPIGHFLVPKTIKTGKELTVNFIANFTYDATGTDVPYNPSSPIRPSSSQLYGGAQGQKTIYVSASN